MQDINIEMNKLLQQNEKVIKKRFEIKNKLIESESKEKLHEFNLWTQTNFKKMGLTNADQRKAYIKRELSQMIKRSDIYKNQLNLCDQILDLIQFKLYEISRERILEDKDYNKVLEDLFSQTNLGE